MFAYADDIRNLARHMSERGSTPMMGSKLALEIITTEQSGVGATYRYTGRVMGVTVDFSETVTAYVLGREKVWHTIGAPRLLIIDSHEMRVLVEPVSETRSTLTISIDYTLPRRLPWRLFGQWLAATYARWCLDSMIEGTKRDVNRGNS